MKRFETGYIDSGEAQLYAGFHPCSGAEAGVLMLSPFGEERKCAYRLMSEFAGMLSRDFAVLRFDYSGTGESTGDHAEVSLASWAEDARTAMAELRERAGVQRLVLLGARLGANLALRLAAAEASRVVLWEPLVSGQAFLDELLRRKQIKEMMSGGSAESLAAEAATAWESGKPVDFDGYAVGPEMSAQLRELELAPALMDLSAPVLLLHVTGAKRLTGRWPQIETALAGREDAELQLVRQKPFWGLADYQENSAIKDPTAVWLGLRNQMQNNSE